MNKIRDKPKETIQLELFKAPIMWAFVTDITVIKNIKNSPLIINKTKTYGKRI